MHKVLLKNIKIKDTKITDLLSVEVCPDKKYPLNIKFEYKPDEGISQKGKGPGVYAISYKGKIVYIGQHIAKAKGVVEDRCLKHLQTFTSRSLDLILGTSLKKWHKLMADNAEAGGFYNIINDIVNQGSVESSKNRIRFSERHWEDFGVKREEDVTNILNGFAVSWFKVGPFEDGEYEHAKGIVKHIESQLICRYLPECNSEFHEVIQSYEKRCQTATHESLTKEINELINEVSPNESKSVVTDDSFIICPNEKKTLS
jgi:hypothetical protein